MTQIERRKAVVTLYTGNFQAELADLKKRMLAEFVKEESGESPRRAGTKSKANALAREYDAKLAEAETSGVEVVLHEITNMQWTELADQHPPPEGDARSMKVGWNVKTFPPALTRASIGETDLDLDSLSMAHSVKLNDAAWELHNGDDSLPFGESMVSLLKQARDSARKPQPDGQ